jgi:hypothetical protein
VEGGALRSLLTWLERLPDAEPGAPLVEAVARWAACQPSVAEQLDRGHVMTARLALRDLTGLDRQACRLAVDKAMELNPRRWPVEMR